MNLSQRPLKVDSRKVEAGSAPENQNGFAKAAEDSFPYAYPADPVHAALFVVVSAAAAAAAAAGREKRTMMPEKDSERNG